jgi:Domain of unknown function (DUF4124)
MKWKNSFFVFLAIISFSLNAEVYKCTNAAGKTLYQNQPCSTKNTQSIIRLKEATPEEAEAAKEKLNAWQQQQALEEADKGEESKQRQAELERQERLQLERRNVIAQERQAAAAQQQQQQYNRALVIPAYEFGPYYRYNPLYPSAGGRGDQYDHYDRWKPNRPIQTDQYPPYKPYVPPPPPPFRSSSNPIRNNPPNMHDSGSRFEEGR